MTNAFNKLESILINSKLFKQGFELVVYGSFANGLFSEASSDLDLSLIIGPYDSH
jgi:DNA polymerase sigma